VTDTEQHRERHGTEIRQYGAADLIRRSGYVIQCRLACFCGMLLFAIATLVIAVVLEQHGAARERAESDAANLSAAFEEQVHHMMDHISGAMELLKHHLESAGAAFDLVEWARRVPEFASSTAQIAIISPDGKLMASTRDARPYSIDLSDRDYFRNHRDNADPGLFIGKPSYEPFADNLLLHVTKRIERPGGGFAGVVVFSTHPDFFTRLHRKIDLGKTGSMSLLRRDGLILARFNSEKGSHAAYVGRATPQARAVIDSGEKPSGGFTGPSLLDGVTRIVQWRALPGYPLIVVVGLGEEEALAPANRHAKMVIGLGAAAFLLVLVMTLILNREIDRRVSREIALQDDDDKLRALNETLIEQHAELLATSAALAQERMKLTRINEELAFAKKVADEASRAKTSFLANMSHELRTPLNAIIGFSEIIRDRLFGENSPRYSECAADIQISGTHLLNIINGVLDVAKIEAGKFVLSETVMPLPDLINQCLVAVTPQAVSGDVAVVVDLPEPAVHLKCDETRFKQILINLLSNAIKFTPAGGKVTLNAQAFEDGAMQLNIQDTGIGMSQEELANAFELFHQADNSIARRFQGTGLGLPLASQLAELHGATLEMESTPNVGTLVRLWVPASRVIKPEASKKPTEADHYAERRIVPRDSVTRVVFIHCDRERFETKTVDLSETGVRIERVIEVSQGDRVRVEMDKHVAEGIVVWANRNHIGLKFLEPAPEYSKDTEESALDAA
jgi:two-component system cell cycle sensor histidine kinase PleC